MPYQVINLNAMTLDGRNRGEYTSLEDARGCVAFDELTRWQIWKGDNIVEENDDVE